MRITCRPGNTPGQANLVSAPRHSAYNQPRDHHVCPVTTTSITAPSRFAPRAEQAEISRARVSRCRPDFRTSGLTQLANPPKYT